MSIGVITVFIARFKFLWVNPPVKRSDKFTLDVSKVTPNWFSSEEKTIDNGEL